MDFVRDKSGITWSAMVKTIVHISCSIFPLVYSLFLLGVAKWCWRRTMTMPRRMSQTA